MAWNMRDLLWLDVSDPKFGHLAEVGRFVRAGFVDDIPCACWTHFDRKYRQVAADLPGRKHQPKLLTLTAQVTLSGSASTFDAAAQSAFRRCFEAQIDWVTVIESAGGDWDFKWRAAGPASTTVSARMVFNSATDSRAVATRLARPEIVRELSAAIGREGLVGRSVEAIAAPVAGSVVTNFYSEVYEWARFIDPHQADAMDTAIIK